ncbi:MFS transporter [Primorskyibacter aestuariivivens]|uniref:MFS transporter n=1 Tax=Primorskyibacter aestuariivivens TaxID=1888912 RepID=UPI002300374D|nr:MFS transporter [Primorskyibacter aestuariivivens]MDA7428045.1 MFS transporter [Primorskyibacter aestuariivivens]
MSIANARASWHGLAMISSDDIRAARAPLACFATIGMVWGAFAAQVPVIKAQIGASDGVFGLSLLVASFGAVGAMWTAPRMDGWLGRWTLPVLALVLGFAFVVPSLAGAPVAFTLGMLCCTCSAGTLDVVMNARVSSVEARRRRPLMNFAHGLFSLAYGLSALLVGLLREAGFSPLTVFALLGVLNLVLVREALRDHGEPLDEDDVSHTDAAPGLLIVAGMVILIAFMAEQATEGWSALHIERSLGGGAAEGAMGPALLGLTMAAGRFGGQALVKSFSEIAVLAVAAVLSAAGAFMAAMAEGLFLAYAGFAVLGLGVSVVAPMAFSFVGRHVSNRARTAAIARISVIGYAGFFIGPPIMGFVSEGFGLSTSFAVMGVALLLVTFILAPMLASHQGRSHAE